MRSLGCLPSGLHRGNSLNPAEQITLGLKHIHDSSLVHLDIKPGNLFLKDGVLKIGDFGRCASVPACEGGENDLAWLTTNTPSAHVSKGAARFEEGMEGDRRYMAPELLKARWPLRPACCRH